jgi:hypothetical protein
MTTEQGEEKMTGINDITNGQCAAIVNIQGEDFQCALSVEHDGWAHSNPDGQVIW